MFINIKTISFFYFRKFESDSDTKTGNSSNVSISSKKVKYYFENKKVLFLEE